MMMIKSAAGGMITYRFSKTTTLLRSRFMSSSSSSSSSSSFPPPSSSYTVKVPTTNPLKSWESGARLVKNTKVVDNQYLEHIRDIHDPSQHLKTIEDELKGTIGKALGKQGDKIIIAMRCMAQEYAKYEALLEGGHGPSSEEVIEVAKKYNEFREQAHKRRWELIVHRQAVGFIVGNHKFVMEKFPIGDALPVEVDVQANSTMEEEKKLPEKKVFGDQLDWWQKVGRWR
eukprot:scaffold1036_cov93-Cylindrotheca_fusiformis.AAC.1